MTHKTSIHAAQSVKLTHGMWLSVVGVLRSSGYNTAAECIDQQVAKTPKMLSVKVDGVTYQVSRKAIASVHAMFKGKKARAAGVEIHMIRARMDRALGRPGAFVHNMPVLADVYASRRRDRDTQHRVADALADRMVQRWVRGGYLEKCGRARYRLAQVAK